MARPTWLAYAFVAVVATVFVYSVGRLALAKRLGRRDHVAVTISHGLMGLAMVGMLVPRWSWIPAGAWELVFGALALYFSAVSVRFVAQHGFGGTESAHGHHLSHSGIHAVLDCAMLYMYWLGMPITGSRGSEMAMSGPPTSAGDPGLTLLIIAVLLASAVSQLDAIGRFSPASQLALSALGGGSTGAAPLPAGAGNRPWLAPRAEVACHIAMCLSMGYMLVLMV
jgi:hypothetical protein